MRNTHTFSAFWRSVPTHQINHSAYAGSHKAPEENYIWGSSTRLKCNFGLPGALIYRHIWAAILALFPRRCDAAGMRIFIRQKGQFRIPGPEYVYGIHGAGERGRDTGPAAPETASEICLPPPRRHGNGCKIACSVVGRAANVKSVMSFYSAFCLLICLFILARFVVFSDLLKIIFHWFRSKYFTFQANFFVIRSGIFIFGNGNALDWRVTNVDREFVCINFIIFTIWDSYSANVLCLAFVCH